MTSSQETSAAIAVIGRERPHGKLRQIVVRLPLQIELTVHEGLTAERELVSISYKWKVLFNGREVGHSRKDCPNEAKAMRAARLSARDWARRARVRGGL